MAGLSRKKKIILLLAALGISGYASYKVCKSSYVARKRRSLAAFLSSLSHLLEAFSSGIDSTSLLTSDLRDFLLSDGDEVPRSLRQSMKLVHCPEFQDALTVFSACISRGVVRSVVDLSGPPRRNNGTTDGRVNFYFENKEQFMTFRTTQKHVVSESRNMYNSEGLPERLLQKLFSESGKGFASAVLGSVARRMVLSVFEAIEKVNVSSRSEWELRGLAPDADGSEVLHERLGNTILDLTCSSRGRLFFAECIQAFVGTAVTVYLEKTKDVNFCEEIVAGVTKPSYQPAVKEMLTSVCSGAVETFVRTSHEVLSASPLPEPPEKLMENLSSSHCEELGETSGCSSEKLDSDNMVPHRTMNTLPNWVDGISRTLAVPSNRKLLIDVAGTVTSEAVHSFFEVFIGVIKPYLRGNYLRRSLNKQVEVVSCSTSDRVVVVCKEMLARSLVIMTVCLAIIMHVLVDVRVLEPVAH